MTVAYCGSPQMKPVWDKLGIAWFNRAVTLQVTGEEVDDESIDELSAFTRLNSLELRNTKVSAAGIETLRQRLPRCRIIGPKGEIYERRQPAWPTRWMQAAQWGQQS